MSAPTRMTTTKLVVHDLEKTAAFYCGAYGFVEQTRIQAEIDGEPIDEILLAVPGVPGVPLILMKFVEREAPPLGEVALVFMSDDLDALFERVVEHGGSVRVAPYQSDTTPFRAGFSADPEGHLIENIQAPSE